MTNDDNKNIKQNTEPKKNIFGAEIMPDVEVNLSEAKKKSIKLWLIIGTAILPIILFIGRAIINFDGVAFLFFLIYLGTIPLCYGTIKAVYNSKSRYTLQKWATFSAFFCSLPGGMILLLELVKVDKAYKEGKSKVLAEAPTQAPKQEVVRVAPHEVTDEKIIVKEEPKVASEEKKESATNTPRPVESKLETPKDNYLPRYNELQGLIENYEINHNLNDLKRLVNIANYLSSKDYKDAADIYEKYSVIYKQKETEKALARKKRRKKIGVFALGFAVVVAVVVPVSLVVPNVMANKRYEKIYNQVNDLLTNYDDTNYNQIRDLIDELEGSEYDRQALLKELNNNHYYENLVKAIGSYDKNRACSNDAIEDYLDKITSNSFKKVSQIKTDFTNVKYYTGCVYTDDSITGDATVTDSEGRQNRSSIKSLYNDCNTSALWNFDYYVKNLAIPYVVCDAEFSTGDYSFKWYKAGTDGQISFYLPLPFTYTTSDTVYFETAFSGAGYVSSSSNDRYTNELQFYLFKNGTRYDWFRIDEVSFVKASGKFSCKVFLNVNNSTLTFTEV